MSDRADPGTHTRGISGLMKPQWPRGPNTIQQGNVLHSLAPSPSVSICQTGLHSLWDHLQSRHSKGRADPMTLDKPLNFTELRFLHL